MGTKRPSDGWMLARFSVPIGDPCLVNQIEGRLKLHLIAQTFLFSV